ncbi:MAG: hypothetical protein DI629_20895 [Mesorhizobium amorphae]|nr:MAG: hypothetical protein DI629_20895 [Mesorhizobium amorphae]
MNYSTLASFVVPASPDEAKRIIALHEAMRMEDADDPAVAAFLANLLADPSNEEDVLEVFSNAMEVRIQEDANGLWFSAQDKNFSNDYAAMIVSHHLEISGRDDVVSWLYADSGSRPALDAFGGGVAVVSAKSFDVVDLRNLQNGIVNDFRAKARAEDAIERVRSRFPYVEDAREALGLDEKVHDLYGAKAAELNNGAVEDVIAELVRNGADPAGFEPDTPAPSA